MKIAILLGTFCSSHRPINFHSIYDGQRGLSGSDLIFCEFSKEFKRRGWDVSIFTVLMPDQPSEWEGCKVFDIGRRHEVIKSDWDVVLCLSEPDMLIGLPKEPLRVISQQLNGFGYCQPGWSDQADLFFSPSQGHLDHHRQWIPDESKWHVVPDGCDPTLYEEGKKVPGRVIWVSSPDRGAHWLLSIWSKVKEAVPHASLRIFYNLNAGNTEQFEPSSKEWSPDIIELGNRYRYIKEASKRLAPLGIELVGSTSREGIRKEFNEAEVLAFSCDTVAWTEGFSITTLEACAHRACPVITSQDALGSIYGGTVPMVPAPIKHHLEEYTKLVIRALEDAEWRNKVNDSCREFAIQHSWQTIVDRMESIFKQHPKYKNVPSSPKRIEERYVNKICINQPTSCRYWVTPNLMVGGSVCDADDWNHLKNDIGIEAVINVETEHSNVGRGFTIEHLLESVTPDNGNQFTVNNVKEVVEFAKKHKDKKLYLHCQMGSSRSPAFAYAVLRYVDSLSPQDALAKLNEIYPESQLPNGGGTLYGAHPYHVNYMTSIESALQSFNTGIAETYLNSFTSTNLVIPRYWVTPNLLVGGNILNKDDVNHLKNEFGIRSFINVDRPMDLKDMSLNENEVLQFYVADEGEGFPEINIHQVLKFADTNWKNPIYVNCHIGFSRSPHFAYSILRHCYKLNQEEAYSKILASLPSPQHNYGFNRHTKNYISSIESALKSFT
jgi:predicted protein tyrosine phosphatase/glycosyltransferase involved in cell wall biosynthesis